MYNVIWIWKFLKLDRRNKLVELRTTKSRKIQKVKWTVWYSQKPPPPHAAALYFVSAWVRIESTDSSHTTVKVFPILC